MAVGGDHMCNALTDVVVTVLCVCPCRWVFTQMYAKGLVYKGLKVMPVSTGCATTLANFEAGQNYKVL